MNAIRVDLSGVSGVGGRRVKHHMSETAAVWDQTAVRSLSLAGVRETLPSSSTPIQWQVAIPLVLVLVLLLYRVGRLCNAQADKELSGLGREEPLLPQDQGKRAAGGKRVVALDVLRGITICFMVFVNYGGGDFAAFTHSAWDGLSVADTLFPIFAWIMGFTVWLVANPGQGSRSLKLLLLGLFLNNGTDWQHWRIPGVLQALAVAYIVVAAINLAGIESYDTTEAVKARSAALSVTVIAAFVIANVLVTFTLPVPGCPTGYIGPGGNKTITSNLGEDIVLANCTGGAHLYVDLVVFGQDHIYQTPTCQKEFGTGPFDPEGLLNWFMVAGTALIGYRSAISAVKLTPERTILPKPLAWASGVLVGVGVAVSTGFFGLTHLFGARWTGIPVNKNLWSLPFVLVSSGIASGLLFLLVVALNASACFSSPRVPPSARRWVWTYARYPWIFVGTNSIAIYAMHEICQQFAPFAAKAVDGDASRISQLELLLFNLVGVLWWVFVATWLHQREVFIKV